MSILLKSVALICILSFASCRTAIPRVPSYTETVMSEGMRITVTNSTGTLTITAGKGLERCYTWEGDTRCVVMWPRDVRWYGSLGLYFPGSGNHWKEHNRITRAVVDEGQMHFKSTSEALAWINDGSNRFFDFVYSDDGLVVGWCKFMNPENGPGSTLSAQVWQLYINGNKPTRLQGSQNDKIVIDREHM